MEDDYFLSSTWFFFLETFLNVILLYVGARVCYVYIIIVFHFLGLYLNKNTQKIPILIAWKRMSYNDSNKSSCFSFHDDDPKAASE